MSAFGTVIPSTIRIDPLIRGANVRRYLPSHKSLVALCIQRDEYFHMGRAERDSDIAKIAGLPADALAACYDEMRRMARRIMAGNALGRVLQPTELANEAAIRLIRANLENVHEEGHLLAIAARTMRRLLVDEARKGMSAKRHASTLMTLWPGGQDDTLVDLRDLDSALTALAALSPARAEIVELRFMLGMTVEETAAATGIAERTVKRHWQAARAWLLAHLNGDGFEAEAEAKAKA